MPYLPRSENDLLPAVRATIDPDTGLVRVHLDKVTHGYLNQPVHYQGGILHPLKELSITVLSGLEAAFLSRHLKNHPEDIADVQDLVSVRRWTYRKTGKYFFVQDQPGVGDIIELVEVPEMAQFFKDLSQLAGRGFILPLTYVALYTSKAEGGVAPSELDQKIKTRIRPDEFLPPDSIQPPDI